MSETLSRDMYQSIASIFVQTRLKTFQVRGNSKSILEERTILFGIGKKTIVRQLQKIQMHKPDLKRNKKSGIVISIDI